MLGTTLRSGGAGKTTPSGQRRERFAVAAATATDPNRPNSNTSRRRSYQMSTSNSIRHAVRYALLTGATAAAAVPAFAADQTIQEVVVTGSRIAQPNLETTSPVTQVTADDIAVQGVTRVEDLVNQLPQAFAAQ